MNSIFALLALGLAPGTYLAIVIYGKDKYDREPKKILLTAFILGALAIIPAACIELAGDNYLKLNPLSLLDMGAESFIVVALVEELCKFLVVRFHAFRKKEFNEPFDGIVYATFVSLGFATAENVIYVLQNGFSTGLLRMFTAVPAHYAFGVVMGYYVGKAKFDEKNKAANLFKGLFFATLLHGAYDFFALQQAYPALTFFMVVVLSVSWQLARKSITELQNDSIFRFKSQLAPVTENIPHESSEIKP